MITVPLPTNDNASTIAGRENPLAETSIPVLQNRLGVSSIRFHNFSTTSISTLRLVFLHST